MHEKVILKCKTINTARMKDYQIYTLFHLYIFLDICSPHQSSLQIDISEIQIGISEIPIDISKLQIGIIELQIRYLSISGLHLDTFISFPRTLFRTKFTVVEIFQFDLC